MNARMRCCGFIMSIAKSRYRGFEMSRSNMCLGNKTKKLTNLPKMPEDISGGRGQGMDTIVEIADIEDDDWTKGIITY
jgi:hypothetical protein